MESCYSFVFVLNLTKKRWYLQIAITDEIVDIVSEEHLLKKLKIDQLYDETTPFFWVI